MVNAHRPQKVAMGNQSINVLFFQPRIVQRILHRRELKPVVTELRYFAYRALPDTDDRVPVFQECCHEKTFRLESQLLRTRSRKQRVS